MARKHHKPEEIVAKLRQVEVLVGQATLAWRRSANGEAWPPHAPPLACSPCFCS
jgi:hypothetical protein